MRKRCKNVWHTIKVHTCPCCLSLGTATIINGIQDDQGHVKVAMIEKDRQGERRGERGRGGGRGTGTGGGRGGGEQIGHDRLVPM